MSIIWPIVKSALAIYILLCAAIYFLQHSLIYHPTSSTAHPFKTIKVSVGDHTVEALSINPDANEVIVYFGGNAENVAYSAADFERQFPQHNTYLLKYRGYSGAAGEASEANLFADALVLFDHIKQHQSTKITIIGRSLGSGVAAFLATERTADKLILVTPFDSIRAVAQSMFPFLPIQLLLKDHFDSKARAEKFKIPTLVVRATNDEVIAAQHTLSLIESIPTNLATLANINAGHNDLDLMPEYFSVMNHFLNQ